MRYRTVVRDPPRLNKSFQNILSSNMVYNLDYANIKSNCTVTDRIVYSLELIL